MGTKVRVISTSSVHASNNPSPNNNIIHLTPWDLQIPARAYIQKGLLFRTPKDHSHINIDIIQHLKHSLSRVLHFFPPLVGRLTFDENLNDNTCSSVSILCNNAGALFVHAFADDTTVSDVLRPTYLSPIVPQFFQLDGATNVDIDDDPLLAVQVTELVDGYFIACSINHVVADGTSFWHFFNSWAEISRALDDDTVVLSKLPVLERWFPSDVDPPIWIPNYVKQDRDELVFSPSSMTSRVFHFTKEKIGELKARANAEVNHNNNNKMTISSLQALLSHIWGSVVRNQERDSKEEVRLSLPVGVRQRITESPTLGANYFGNAVKVGYVTMKAEELVEGGVGKAALEINKIIGLHTEKMLKSCYECWIKDPISIMITKMRDSTVVVTNSPKFDIYGNDFGWGQPVAVRCGPMSYSYGNLTLFAGAEEGSIDIHVFLDYEMLEAMANDSQFMDAVSL